MKYIKRLKKKKEKRKIWRFHNMDKNVIVMVIVGTIFAALFINAQSPTDNEGNLVDNSNAEGDLAFLKWANMVSESMRSHILDISNATKIDDYDNLEKYGKYLQIDTALYINQSRQFNVSSTVKPIIVDIQKSLENYEIVGKYIETGGKNHDDNSLYTAVDYAKKAEDYMRNASVEVQNHVYK